MKIPRKIIKNFYMKIPGIFKMATIVCWMTHPNDSNQSENCIFPLYFHTNKRTKKKTKVKKTDSKHAQFSITSNIVDLLSLSHSSG